MHIQDAIGSLVVQTSGVEIPLVSTCRTHRQTCGACHDPAKSRLTILLHWDNHPPRRLKVIRQLGRSFNHLSWPDQPQRSPLPPSISHVCRQPSTEETHRSSVAPKAHGSAEHAGAALAWRLDGGALQRPNMHGVLEEGFMRHLN